VTWLPAAVVTITWRVSGLSSETTPITLNAVMAGSFEVAVWAFRAAAPASKASAHSTRMLPTFLMIFPWLYSQLISAQNQWIAALNEVNTTRFGICGKKKTTKGTKAKDTKAHTI
jgi:hypothetical protein